jgi:transposase
MYIGCDVGKYNLDFYIEEENKYIKIKNNEKDIKDFIKTLNNKDYIVAIDLTGGYEVLCRDLFYNKGFKVVLCEGYKINKFRQCLKKAKTDKLDAKLLIDYVKTFKNNRFYNKENETLKKLYGRLQVLKDYRQQEKNRSKAPDNNLIKDNVLKMLDFLDLQIKELENSIEKQITETQKEKYDLLLKQKGIGKATAISIIATLPELGKESNKTIAALCGLAPMTKESGRCKFRSKTLTARDLKSKIFICVLSQLRYNKEFIEKLESFLKRGKSKMLCIIALCRKFIVRLNAMVRDKVYKEI